MKKGIFILSLLASASQALLAAIPDGYYSRLNGKATSELKTAAYEIINPHTKVSSYSNLPQYFQETDVYPESRRWWDMYSDVVRYIPSFSGLNREHSFPKSWWKVGNSVEYTPAYTDLNHLYPADGPANQAKSNYPFATVNRAQNVKFDNGVSMVGYPVSGQGGGAQYVFEPADEYKGDFARTVFYMVTCYQDLQWNTNYLWMVQRNTYPTLTPWAVNLMLQWHRADPVSQKEIDRNEVVYSFQNNRNPFIDFPELAEYIWGNKMGENFTLTSGGSTGTPTLTAPVPETTLDLGQVALGQTAKALLYFKGESLSSDLSVSLGGDDRAMFSIPQRTISQQILNAPSGFYLEVTYTPTSIGTHNGRLLIYDGGLTGSVYVYLKGEAVEVPQLSALSAYPATDVTSDTYKASWSPAPEVVDYYILTRTRYVEGGNTEVEEIECEEPEALIDGFSGSTQETYAVQSYRLGYRSPMSNVVFVNHSGLETIEREMPLTARSYEGCILLQCSTTHTDLYVYDASGRVVTVIPELRAPGMELTLPAGVYILTSREHPTPVKLLAR